MPKTKNFPVIKSIIVALIFFALGRLMAMRWGDAAFWLTFVLLVIFYAGWWAFNRR